MEYYDVIVMKNYTHFPVSLTPIALTTVALRFLFETTKNILFISDK